LKNIRPRRVNEKNRMRRTGRNIVKVASRSRGRGGSVAGGIAKLAAVITLLIAGVRAGAESVPVVEVTAPGGPVRVGRRFSVSATVSWEGEGTEVDVGRPAFEVPENLRLEISSQECRTALRDGIPRSEKKYDLVFIAEKEGRATIGPLIFNARREENEFGLTGRAVDVEVVRGRSTIWVVAIIAAFVVLGIAILIYKRKRKNTKLALAELGQLLFFLTGLTRFTGL